MLTLMTNLASASIQNALYTSQRSLQRSVQRLSTGLRINSAADDAAGLAIATSMGAKLASTQQGIRNANDGISMAQTIDGALSSITNILTRIRTLAVQASSGTLSDPDREAIQAEYDQLTAEITNIKANTQFNGIQPLASNTPSVSFQVGPDSGDTVSMPLLPKDLQLRTFQFDGGFVDTSTLTDNNSYNNKNIAFQVGNNTVNINTVDDGVSPDFGYGSALALKNAIDASHITNMSVSAVTNANLGQITDPTLTTYTGPIDLTIDGVKVNDINWDASSGTPLGQAIADQINSQFASNGLQANYIWHYYDNNQIEHTFYSLYVTAPDGRNIEISTTGDTNNAISFDNMSLNDGVAKDKTAIGVDELQSNWPVGVPLSVTHGLSVQDGQGKNVPTGPFAAPIVSDVMLNQDTARAYISAVDAQISQITSYRSQVGAVQNELQATVSQSEVYFENLTDARSRILDADFATETANLTRCQILQQAGASLLVQANAYPNVALSLLKM